MLVESRAVRAAIGCSRPASRPTFRASSSPLGVPGVCAGNWALESNFAMPRPAMVVPFVAVSGAVHNTESVTSARPSGVVIWPLVSP